MKNQIAVLPSLRRAVGRWITAGAMALAILSPLTALPLQSWPRIPRGTRADWSGRWLNCAVRRSWATQKTRVEPRNISWRFSRA